MDEAGDQTAREAERQQRLLGALSGQGTAALREQGARATRGVEAYQANAQASAERALASIFPTVQTMLGHEDFKRLACEFWLAHPPVRGDLGEWGAAFADWLQAHPAMAPWPYLGDAARLDFAIHANERAADAGFDATSLAQLESTDPARLRMVLVPGTAWLHSRWPIVAIHRAHALDGDAAEQAFAALRDAIAAPFGEDALVVREGWRAAVHRLDASEARWIGALLAGESLATSIERAGEGFDLAAWLQRAIRGRWLKGVEPLDD